MSVVIETTRRALTALYHAQAVLPNAVAKQWRLLTTLALQLLPAIDPSLDPFITEYSPPTSAPFSKNSGAVLVTGGTGMVGIHLIDHLLRTTTRAHADVLLRAMSSDRRIERRP